MTAAMTQMVVVLIKARATISAHLAAALMVFLRGLSVIRRIIVLPPWRFCGTELGSFRQI